MNNLIKWGFLLIALIVVCITTFEIINNFRPVAMEECWNDGELNEENLYCKGFHAGYNWQRTQVLMDCEFIQYIDHERK